jgi:hypothetical protein
MNVNRKVLTLDEFTIQQLRHIPNATGELSSLLRDIGLASKRVNVEVNKAGLVDILGDAGSVNVQGEDVKKLDVFANDQFTGVLKHGISCAGIASEELDDIVVFDDEVSNNSKYVCMYDPLDGSANIDVNVSIGTIFAVFRRLTKIGEPCDLGDFLQKGINIPFDAATKPQKKKTEINTANCDHLVCWLIERLVLVKRCFKSNKIFTTEGTYRYRYFFLLRLPNYCFSKLQAQNFTNPKWVATRLFVSYAATFVIIFFTSAS